MSRLSFEYRALDRSGSETRGVLQALTEQEAYRQLAASGLTPLRLRVATGRKLRVGRGTTVRTRELANFTYQLSVLLEARLPVVQCFTGIAEQEPNERFRKVIEDIAAQVDAGAPVTEAFENYERIFGPVYIETMRAAEKSGNMIEVLRHLAAMLEEQEEMKRVVRGALMYPIIVTLALILAVVFLVTFVVPKFANMFLERGVDLPLLTRLLMITGTSIKGYWYLYIAGVVATIFFARRAWRHPKGRVAIDRYLHRLPVVRNLLIGLGVGRFAGVFGLCLNSGLGLIDSLEMGGRASGRPLLVEDVSMMVEQVRRGGRMSEVLRRCAYMPPFVKQLFSAGEESAELTRMCEIVTRHYSHETKHIAKNSSTIVEPVLIAGLTGVVLMVALAIFLPMWDMVTVMGG